MFEHTPPRQIVENTDTQLCVGLRLVLSPPVYPKENRTAMTVQVGLRMDT